MSGAEFSTAAAHVHAGAHLELVGKLLAAREDAKRNAWLCLSKYKFWMFGYYAARWVTLGMFLPRERNPFAELVRMAQAECHIKGYTKTKGEDDGDSDSIPQP